jgi:PEGA domain
MFFAKIKKRKGVLRMRALKIFFLVLVLSVGFGLFTQKAEAQKTPVPYSGGSRGGYHGGYHGYHRGYYYPYYYRPYWGLGFGWGYPYYGWGYPYYGYGYGYGYPYVGYYQGYGEVKAEVKPKDAHVYLDGDYVGIVDDFNSWYQRMNVEPGKHRIVFRAQGYQPYAINLRVLPGETYHIKQQMHPGVDEIPDSDMRLPESEYREYSDRYRDHPDQNREYPDRDRQYDKRYAPPQREYEPEDRDDYQYNRNLEPYGSDGDSEEYQQAAPGKTMMTFQVEPRDATIYIDGDYYGSVDGQKNNEIQVLLADGTHRVEVVRPGYSTFSKDIVVNDGATNSITIQLEKK